LETDKEHAVTEKIIGFAMRIHRVLGPGFLEAVYLNALVHELRRNGFSAEDPGSVALHRPVNPVNPV
jgi:GxxExxY protein